MSLDPEFDRIAASLSAKSTGIMRVFGVRRSGQHAIIGWILRNCGQASPIFLNNRRIGQSPFRAGRPMEKNPDSSRNAGYLTRRIMRSLEAGERPFVLISYEGGFDPERHAAGDISPGFENRDFAAEIMVLRRFVNWLPSMIRLKRRSLQDEFDLSQAVLLEIQRYKAHLRAAMQARAVVIVFDRWAAQAGYRRQKLAELGLPEIDNGLGAVQPFGGGSSFSGMDLAAEDLALDRRWEAMRNDRFALDILRIARADAEFIRLISPVFPDDKTRISELLA